MQRVKGDIETDGNIIFRGVEILLHVSVSPRSGLQSWSGQFSLPGWQHLDQSVSYRLLLKDGRSGEFFIKRLNPGTHHPTYVHFIGNGALE